jgi:hypothetical protein
MKISRKGLELIASRIKVVDGAIAAHMKRPKMSEEQQENFRELKEEFNILRRQYAAFSKTDAGT